MRLQRLLLELAIVMVCAENVQRQHGSETTSPSTHSDNRNWNGRGLFSVVQSPEPPGSKAYDARIMEENPVYSGTITACNGTALKGTVPYNEVAYWKIRLKKSKRTFMQAKRISCGMSPQLSLHEGTDLTNLPAPILEGTNSISIPNRCVQEYPTDKDPKLVVRNIPTTGDYTIRIVGAGVPAGSDFRYKIHVFSLDTDGDGVGDGCDMCLSTALNETIKVSTFDTGVADAMVGNNGCSVNDLIPETIRNCVDFAKQQPGSLDATKKHFRVCMYDELILWENSGVFSSSERQEVMKYGVRKAQHTLLVGSCNTLVKPTKITCSWSPRWQKGCRNLLSARLPYSHSNHTPDCKRMGHRWIFFGDSTILRLVRMTELIRYLAKNAADRIQNQCPDKFSCEYRMAEEGCMYNEIFDIPYRQNLEWTPPDWANNAEGPVKNVPNRPYCHDCGGCKSEFLVCRDQRPEDACDGLDAPVAYGGFLTVEFARDVEMQSPEFLTTQENMAAFLSQAFSHKPIIESLGRPVCVVNTGTHDAQIPGITTAKFLNNVEWYLSLLEPHCEYLIYIATVAPAGERFPGHFNLTYEWNMGVRDLLKRIGKFKNKSTFINVFNTTINEEHADKVHMTPEWYEEFARFFLSIIQD